jgi:diguanylate cyclase (GGDEF)-like protein
MAVEFGQKFDLPLHPAPALGGRGVVWPWRGLHSLARLFTIPADDPELAVSQLTVLSGQIPLLYIVLLSSALALAATHYALAPRFLVCAVPALLTCIATLRGAMWLRWRSRKMSGPEALLKLRGIVFMVSMLSIGLTGWAFTLFPYGGAYARCHVEFFLSITVIACAFCLMHLRSGALLLIIIFMVPFSIFFIFYSGQITLVAIACNMLVVTVGMVLALLRSYSNFAALVVSEGELRRRQRETQRLSDENLRLANLDTLTSLPNRRRFFAELDSTLARATQDGRRFAVALLDLDCFKGVNDAHGHAAGDRLLTQIGLRLKRLVNDTVFIARLGGDEFGVILSACETDAPIFEFGAEVKRQLEGPCVIGDRLAIISCSIGVAIYPQAGASCEELFERADYALCHGKQTRKGEVVVFSDEHESSIRRAAEVEQVFRMADLEAETWVAFQPIVDVTVNRVIAFEALARWESRELGEVGPDVFVPIAERTQMVGALTAILLVKALAAARGWPAQISICFNLSAQNLASPETMEVVRQIVRGSGVPPGRIEFEVTETALLQDFEHAAAAINTLHALGVRIALDDFGTGFSCLSYVHRLPLDKIKIDRSFVSDVTVSRTSPAIIKTVVALCKNLNLACVVEGVETDAQLRAVKALGCHHVQGYLLSRPVNENAVIRVIETIAVSGRVTAMATPMVML